MSVIQRKVWRDLGHNKLRTLLVILSSAIGVFALGIVFGLSDIMTTRLTQDHQDYIPAHITFWGGVFSNDLIAVICEEPGVASVEGEMQVPFRWKRAGEAEWRNGDLIARPDYVKQPMNRIGLVTGEWPGTRNMAIEQQSARYFGLTPGTSIVVEFGRHERELSLNGIIRFPAVTPPQFGGNATFYVTPETMTWIVGLDYFNLLHIRLDEFSQERAKVIASNIEDRLARAGLSAGGYIITDPNVHWMQQMVDTLTWVLAALGVLSLGLSAFLIINTLRAILAQQVWQIGVMKVTGATSNQVMSLYFRMALIYGLCSIVIAVPLSQLAAYHLAGWLLGLLNIEVGEFQITRSVIVLQIGVGLVTPVLAAIGPVIRGSIITPHQAISTYGLGGSFGRSRLDQWMGHIRGLPRPLALSLRNTFRRKIRVVLTLFTLTLGGIIFLVVMSTSTSLNKTLDMVIYDLGLDVWVVFDTPQRVPRLIEVADRVPGVQGAEVWTQSSASIALGSGEEQEVYLMGVPVDSQMFHPNLVSGRRLLPGDDRAILLNNKIAVDRGITVGDGLALTINGRESSWEVVGLVLNVSDEQKNGFVPFDALTYEMSTVGRGSIVMVLSTGSSIAVKRELVTHLREAYIQSGIKPSFLQSADEMREQNQRQFNIITYMMLMMAGLAALVGGIGLMGTMSINVIERKREIGVLRAIGASTPAILGILIFEGVLLGLMSWIVAVLVGYPAAQAFSNMMGVMLMNVPLAFRYSMDAVLIWLGTVIVLSLVSSLVPALSAARISVHEALAYE